MSDPLVSIVLPVYNGERYLSETVDSVLSQSYENYELIFVNDGSTDGSCDIIRHYTDRYSHFRCIEQDNAGVAEARNTGIRSSQGTLIALLDQDDIWLPHKLALQVEYLQHHPQCGLIHSKIGFINGDGQVIPDPYWAWVTETFGNCLSSLFAQNKIATFTALFRKSIVENIGLLRECFAPSDDWDLWLRIAQKHELGFIPELSGYYRLHANNESKNHERMKLAEIGVIDNFLREFVDVKDTIGSRIIRNKYCRLYQEAARLYEGMGKTKVAAHYWIKTLKQSPFYLSAYAGVIINQFSADDQRKIRWYWHRIKSLLPRQS